MKKLQLALTLIFFLTAGCLASPAAARQQYDSVDEVPEIKGPSMDNFVCDPDGYLTEQQRGALDNELRSLRNRTTAEMAVVILPSIGDNDIFDFAQDLASKWGIGGSEKSNGILLLMVMQSRQIRIQTGYGVEGLIPDATASDIIQDTMAPMMRQGNIYGAVSGAVAQINSILSTPDAMEEIRSGRAHKEDALDTEAIKDLLWTLAACGFMFTLFYFIRTALKTRGLKRHNYEKSLIWRKSLLVMGIGTLFSLGSAILLFLLAFFLYRFWRTRCIRCGHCGAKMRRLPEDEDNNYLTPGEDCEEKLKTVDYDVWLCPECGAVDKYPYVENQKFFSKCPRCGTVAYGLDSDRTLVPATTRQAGVGEKRYRCRHCGYINNKRYQIPRKDDDTAALATAAILGAALGRGSGGGGGGGGFSGGSWGGGSFGGGGASGSW